MVQKVANIDHRYLYSFHLTRKKNKGERCTSYIIGKTAVLLKSEFLLLPPKRKMSMAGLKIYRVVFSFFSFQKNKN